ncbi:hypothetical protein ABEB36_004087 [Hypothenemus hampei]|uniref:Histone deacetylase 8 n=1 Tax=Hypothenemus hampei TaxID=57062 RepID=A0ABD1F245_HYPHA
MLLNKIVYIHSENLISHCNKLPSMQNRASVVQDLINSYRLLISSNVAVVKSQDATEEELKSFHSTDYIDLLKSLNSWDSNIDEINDDHLSYGLGYDCPVLDNIYDFACSVAGGSLTAAKLLAAKKCQIVINWFGGWHHANRDFASGFCYINDVVIAIQHLTKTFKRPLYLDLDIHHGDGVQNAFEFSNRILTLSFHKYCPGFFPNTGSSEEKGKGKGTYYSLNVPLKDGIKNQNYIEVFNSIFPLVISKFKPDVLIVQCGADGLNGDSVGECNLTLRGIGECIEKVLACTLPTLFLGGVI